MFTATQTFFMQIDLKALANKTTEIYNKSIEENHELKTLEKELAGINKKLKNLLSAIENGIFNGTTNQRMKELEISKKELKKRLHILLLNQFNLLMKNKSMLISCHLKISTKTTKKQNKDYVY